MSGVDVKIHGGSVVFEIYDVSNNVNISSLR